MSEVDDYLQQLATALHVRGRARRRLLSECRSHLADASAVYDVEEAVRRFGDAGALARSFDTEIAVRRGLRATVASVLGVLGVGVSALAIVHAAEANVSAVVVWAVAFFACAQASGVCALLAVLRAVAMRRGPATAADGVLLCRRNGAALAFALLTLVAAGGAVPGHASAWKVLVGPVVAVLATASIVRSRSLARRIDPDAPQAVQAPLADLRVVARRSARTSSRAGSSSSILLLAPTLVNAAAAAFVWDHQDHGNLANSAAAAGIEAALTVAGFLLLGPVLGLRPTRGTRRGSATT
jgi:hypothetical protein